MGVVPPFRIPAAVLDAFGNAQTAGPASEGLFVEDTRHPFRLVSSIDGIRPLLWSSAVTADNMRADNDVASALRDATHLSRSC